MIKAIETAYKGYRFRSRLEARWATFFDALGIKWEYEKEGYKLSTGWYLPDFWLPDFDFFVEIKPVDIAWEHTYGVYDLENHIPLLRVLLLCGEPGEYTSSDYSDNGLADLGQWAQCRVCNSIGFGYVCSSEYSGQSFCGHQDFSPDGDRIKKAIVAARSARF